MRLFKVLVILSLFAGSFVIAQEKKMEMTPEMKAWMDYAKPGDMHKVLADRAGKWKTEMKMWMQPGAEPEITEGTAEYKMILGGRYLEGWFKGTSMGMPFDGYSVEAYDNTLKKFITVWMDTFGTGITVSYGKYDEKADAMVSKGKMVDPVSGDYIKYKTVAKSNSEDEAVFDMFMLTPDGKEFHSMRITYWRVK